MGNIDYDSITESHLAKKYNDILYDCIMRCNVTGFLAESQPHFENLQSYFAAVYVLYRNTFMLFFGIKSGNSSLAKSLMSSMRSIKKDVREMKNNSSIRTPKKFEETLESCDIIHMRVLDGLQKRHMLVRIGESEPRGEESVFHWDEKESFRKGGVKEPVQKAKDIVQKKPIDNRNNLFENKKSYGGIYGGVFK